MEQTDLEIIRGKRLLLGASGALQCLSLPDLLFSFKDLGVAKIGVVLTPTAAKMTSEYSLSCVADEIINQITPDRNHVQIARDYDRLVVAPATAHFLSQAALGAAGNSLELLHLAMKPPVIIAPAMNSRMWSAPPVQRNVSTLINDGHILVQPHRRKVYEGASRRIKREVSMATTTDILASLYSSFKGDADVD
ncbi:flavoprotein [Corynebacterium belfantii]|uniref:flavoprotein n=1 Tax=Corynebacterium belfantii TaxID=2014537 RepID=UPI00248CDDC7|nr:flavoprotein [Corynebacterium belfantii]